MFSCSNTAQPGCREKELQLGANLSLTMPSNTPNTIGTDSSKHEPYSRPLLAKQPTAAPDDIVTIAAQHTAAAIARDTRLPDLWNLLNGNSLSRDYSYPQEVDLKVKRLTVLPEVLLEYTEGQSPVLMGLLPEIGRAWMASGPRLFLFDCGTPSSPLFNSDSMGKDVIGFEEPSGTPILNVIYAPTKSGIFVDTVRGVLLVATSTRLQVVAVRVDQEEGAVMQLHSTDLQCSTDDVNMLAMHVTRDNRILLGGADGCLYEFEYESVGPKRSLLSMLSVDGVKRQCRLRNLSESFLATALIPNILKRSSSDPIIYISSDDSFLYLLHESSRIDIYQFKPTLKKTNTVGNVAEMVERICPGFVTSSNDLQLVAVEPIASSPYLGFVAVTCTGTRLYFSSLPRDSLSLDPIQLSQLMPPRTDYNLVHIRILIPPSQHHSTDDPRRLIHRHIQPSVHAALPGTTVSLFAVNNSDLADDLVCCMVDPAAVFSRPGQPMMALERACMLPVEGRVWEICRVAGEALNCQQLITKTADPFHTDRFLVLTTMGVYEVEQSRLTEWPIEGAQLVSLWGAEQAMALIMTSCVENPQQHQQRLMSTAPSLLTSTSTSTGNQQQTMVNTQVTLARSALLDSQQLTPALQGAFLCFGRIVGPVWTQDLTLIHLPNYAIFTLLKNLSNLLTVHRSLIVTNTGTDAFYGLVELIGKTAELLSFVMLCQDYQSLPLDQPCSFDSFFSGSTPDHIKCAADLLISKQLSSQDQNMVSVDGIMQILSQRCPSFFGKSEMRLYAGMELLERAKRSRSLNSIVDYQESLTGAISSLVQSCSSMTFAAFERFCRQQLWEEMGSVEGVVQLTAAYAQGADGDNCALLCYQHPTLVNQLDQRQSEAVSAREQSYGVFLECLSSAVNSDKIVQFLKQVSKCQDELLQVRVFDFIKSMNMSGVLLECMMESPYLEPYLLLQFNTGIVDDLLCKYYGMVGRFEDAVRVLLCMANADNTTVPISTRVEWLSRAVAMQSHNTDAQDLLDVAMVQLELYTRLDQDSLNKSLWTLSDLFNRVARPQRCHQQSLRLLELSLQAGNRVKETSSVVASIWHDLIQDTIQDQHLFESEFKSALTRFAHNKTICPLSMLLDHVAQYAVNTNQSPSSIISLFMLPTVTVNAVVEALDGLLLSKRSTFWQTDSRKKFLVQLLCNLADQASSISAVERRLLLDRIDTVKAMRIGGDDCLALLSKSRQHLQ